MYHVFIIKIADFVGLIGCHALSESMFFCSFKERRYCRTRRQHCPALDYNDRLTMTKNPTSDQIAENLKPESFFEWPITRKQDKCRTDASWGLKELPSIIQANQLRFNFSLIHVFLDIE